MSRTIRFKRENWYLPWWNNHVCKFHTGLTDEEVAKLWWKMHKDNYGYFKDPGPHWFRNLFSDRPLRRYANNELRKFMVNTEYEPLISRKYKLDYWT